MSEDHELSRLENEWKDRFDRFTSPEPTRDQTFSLIEKIKRMDEIKPVDYRAELEYNQAAQSMRSKLASLLISQWNFQGMRSWLMTGVVMLILTIVISVNVDNEMIGFMAWIKWITLILIAVMGNAFRSKNEGNDIIEKLSYYSFIQQMFTRFIIVMGLQLLITLPLSFFILGKASSLLYLTGSFVPIFFFGVVGFISAMWFGNKAGVLITLFIWLSQMLVDQQLKFASIFQLPSNEHFLLVNVIVMGVSILLLSSMLLKGDMKRNLR